MDATACLLGRLQKTVSGLVGRASRGGVHGGPRWGHGRRHGGGGVDPPVSPECLFDPQQTAEHLHRYATDASAYRGLFGGAAAYVNGKLPAFPRSQPASTLETWLELRRRALFGAVAQLQTGDADPVEALERVNASNREVPETGMWLHQGEPPRFLDDARRPLRCTLELLTRTYTEGFPSHAHCGARLFVRADEGTEFEIARDARGQAQFVKSEVAHIVDELDQFMGESDRLDVRVERVGRSSVRLSAGERSVSIQNPADPLLDGLEATRIPRQRGGGGGGIEEPVGYYGHA